MFRSLCSSTLCAIRKSSLSIVRLCSTAANSHVAVLRKIETASADAAFQVLQDLHKSGNPSSAIYASVLKKVTSEQRMIHVRSIWQALRTSDTQPAASLVRRFIDAGLKSDDKELVSELLEYTCAHSELADAVALFVKLYQMSGDKHSSGVVCNNLIATCLKSNAVNIALHIYAYAALEGIVIPTETTLSLLTGATDLNTTMTERHLMQQFQQESPTIFYAVSSNYPAIVGVERTPAGAGKVSAAVQSLQTFVRYNASAMNEAVQCGLVCSLCTYDTDAAATALDEFLRLYPTPSEESLIALAKGAGRTRSGLLVDRVAQLSRAQGIRSARLYSALITAQAARGNIKLAREEFFAMRETCSEVDWTAMIKVYSAANRLDDTFAVFDDMVGSGGAADAETTIQLLAACGVARDVRRANVLQKYVEVHFPDYLHVQVSMIRMFGLLRNPVQVHAIFNRLPRSHRNTVTHNAVIQALASCNKPHAAFKHFDHMIHDGVVPDVATILALIRAVSQQSSSTNTKSDSAVIDRIYALAKQHDLMSLSVTTALILLYGAANNLTAVNTLFSAVKSHAHSFTWSSVVGAYARAGEIRTAFRLFDEMRAAQIPVVEHTLVMLANASARMRERPYGMQVMSYAREHGFMRSLAMATAAMDLCGKLGMIGEARAMFAEIRPKADAKAFEQMMYIHLHRKDLVQVSGLLAEMRFRGLQPSARFSNALAKTQQQHAQLLKHAK